MRCHNCGAELTDGVAFCCFCGSAQTTPETAQLPEVIEAPSAICEDPIAVPTPVAEEKPKRPVGLIVAACIAAVLTVVVVLGLCTNWFGFYGPGTRIAVAANNTLKNGNFTVVMSTKTEVSSLGSYKAESEMSVQVDIDMKKQELMLYCETENEYDGQTYTTYTAIYDGYRISGYKMGDLEEYAKIDISDELDEFFDTYEDAKDMDWEELFDLIEEKSGEDPSDYIDLTEFKKCIKTYIRNLNNNKWLEKNAGFSTSSSGGVKYYEFEPNIYKFSKATLECFEAAFEDEDDYNNLMDALKSNRDELTEGELELVFGIKSSKLVELEIKTETDHYTSEAKYEFTNIGKTSIDEDVLEEMLSKAN